MLHITKDYYFHSGSSCTPCIYLTFDDGPDARITPRLLDILNDYNVKCTFFVLGQRVKLYPKIAQRIVNEGHEIANHSWSHKNLAHCSADNISQELELSHDIVLKTTGVKMKNFRPPGGSYNSMVRRIAFKKYGYKTILWSVSSEDWHCTNVSYITNRLLKNSIFGSILLCHDIQPTVPKYIPIVLNDLINRGFQFKRINDLK